MLVSIVFEGVWVDDFMLGIVVLIPPVKKDCWNMMKYVHDEYLPTVPTTYRHQSYDATNASHS